MTDTTTTDLDRVNRELAQVKEALRSPRIGLFESRRLYRRLESLYREQDKLTIDQAVNHVKGFPDETQLATHPTTYRNG